MRGAVAQMDVSMPFMGGLEATQIIRQFEQGHGLDNVPIIALTAHASAYHSYKHREGDR